MKMICREQIRKSERQIKSFASISDESYCIVCPTDLLIFSMIYSVKRQGTCLPWVSVELFTSLSDWNDLQQWDWACWFSNSWNWISVDEKSHRSDRTICSTCRRMVSDRCVFSVCCFLSRFHFSSCFFTEEVCLSGAKAQLSHWDLIERLTCWRWFFDARLCSYPSNVIWSFVALMFVTNANLSKAKYFQVPTISNVPFSQRQSEQTIKSHRMDMSKVAHRKIIVNKSIIRSNLNEKVVPWYHTQSKERRELLLTGHRKQKSIVEMSQVSIGDHLRRQHRSHANLLQSSINKSFAEQNQLR